MAGFKRNTTSNTVTAKSIEDFFVPSIEISAIDGFKIGVFGKDGVGKTHICATAPGTVFYIDTEGTAMTVISKFPFDVRQRIRVFNVKKKYDNDVDIINYPASIELVEEAVDAVYRYTQEHPDEYGTIVIDSASDLWDWLQYWLNIQTDLARAKSGKMIQTEWGRANKRHAKILDMLLKTEWNVILTAQAHPVYGSGGEVTTINDPKWQKGVPFWADVSGELKYENGNATFTIRKCRHDRDLEGSIIEDPTFESIKNFISEKTGIPFKTE